MSSEVTEAMDPGKRESSGTEARPVPPVMTFLAGLVIGMQVEGARKIGASARADLEPSIGPFAGTVLEWLIFLAWIISVTCFIGWFFRLRWVRAAFEQADRRSAR